MPHGATRVLVPVASVPTVAGRPAAERARHATARAARRLLAVDHRLAAPPGAWPNAPRVPSARRRRVVAVPGGRAGLLRSTRRPPRVAVLRRSPPAPASGVADPRRGLPWPCVQRRRRSGKPLPRRHLPVTDG